jgi:hypothetical protein
LTSGAEVPILFFSFAKSEGVIQCPKTFACSRAFAFIVPDEAWLELGETPVLLAFDTALASTLEIIKKMVNSTINAVSEYVFIDDFYPKSWGRLRVT